MADSHVPEITLQISYSGRHGLSSFQRLSCGYNRPAMFPYDPQILTAVRAPAQSISDVLRIMRSIEDTCSDLDGLKWFNWLYLQVTQAVEAKVSAGGFTDPAWLVELDVQFARLYFGALALALSGQPATGCWQVLFERRNAAAIARIQFALAGINAHINHDLPQAIVATCDATSTIPQHGEPQYSDYTGLNSTLDSLIESAKRALHVRLPGDALPPVTHLDDTIAAWSVTAARESAWRNAELLWQVRSQPPVSLAFLDTLDGFTTVVGKTLLVPVP